ncbi:MAG: low molecular weight phosphatase family protein [Candidatus Marsarchaeota archaeon]|jgi:protein-tyrosine-phosphatase|nr:low molecular weight phosphatase family protein [Candidatus Marsarchaeota archaeon]MCL5111359.1 low molecular weight phosphatase family protein [Candidatus Marsarchaeota archaeon]
MKKVLFICKMNAGRSQIAEGFLENLTKKYKALSAGVDVAREGKDGKPLPSIVLEVMQELGYDLSNHRRKQVTPEMIKEAGRVIIILQKPEIENYVPDYIKNSPKAEYWDIEDMAGRDKDFFIEKRNEIRKCVEALIKGSG